MSTAEPASVQALRTCNCDGDNDTRYYLNGKRVTHEKWEEAHQGRDLDTMQTRQVGPRWWYSHVIRGRWARPLTIYAACVAEGIETAHHESDLYIKAVPRARELLKEYGITTASLFNSDDNTGQWWDIPFRYDPFWERKAR